MQSFRSNFNKIINLKNILSKEQTEIVNTAMWLMIPSILTKITGQVYNLFAASYFGTDNIGWNHFILANTIPELLTTTLLVGSVGAVIIPVLTLCKKKDGEAEFYKVYSSIINITVIVFVLCSALIYIFGEQLFTFFLTTFIRPVSPISPAEITNIVDMMKILLIPQLILGVSVFISSGLNLYNRFIIPQLSGLFFNIGRLIAMFVLVPLMNFNPWSLVYGVIIGSVLHIVIQIPLFRKLGIKYQFRIDYKNKYIKDIAKIGIPRMFALASDQIAFAFNKFLAGAFIGGASALTYATSLYIVVPSLFGYTFSYASYPLLSRLFVESEFDKIRKIVQKTLNEIFFLAIPFVVTILVLRVPIVRLTYGIIPGTNFDLNDSFLVAWILLGFTFGLVFITARWFVLNLFYASQDTKTPLIVTSFSLVFVIIFSYLFTNFFSYFPINNMAIGDIPVRLSENFSNFNILFSIPTNILGPVTFLLDVANKEPYSILRWVVLLIVLLFLYYITHRVYISFKSSWGKYVFSSIIASGFIFYILLTTGIIQFTGATQFFVRSDSSAAVAGISFAMSLVYTVEFFALLILFNRNKVNIKFFQLIAKLFPKFVAGGAMMVVMYLLYKIWNIFSYEQTGSSPLSLSGSTTLNILILTIITVLPSFLVYFLICHLLKVEELKILRRYLNPIFSLGGINIKESISNSNSK